MGWPLFAVLLAGFVGGQAFGEEAAAGQTTEAAVDDEPTPPPPLPEPKGATRLKEGAGVWVDRKKGVVMVDGAVSLRRGLLEMFACPRETKEHESIVSVDSPAFLVHAALLSVGAEPGKPVQWEPKYAPPIGDRIDITVEWRPITVDEATKKMTAGKLQSSDARRWVRDLRDGKAMRQHWVFAGSGFWKNEATGKEHYLAEGGDLICVSNFGTAMLDVPDNSPQTNDGLLFEAFTERIPALGTPVRLVLTPKPKRTPKAAASNRGEQIEAKKSNGSNAR